MRFADPTTCPDCRGAIAGQPACPQCGLDLSSLEVRQLWQVLLQADELLDRAARRPRATPAAPAPAAAAAAAAHAAPTAPEPAPATQAAPATPSDPFVAVPPQRQPHPAQPQPQPQPTQSHQPYTPYPAPAAAAGQPTSQPSPQAPTRSWSVGTVLLVLGAFGLVVAGLIFVTRSWEDIGLAGRTLILLGVTAVIGGLGAWVTRRPLRASAEAVWTVFLALLTVDFFAARHEDLAGLGTLDVAAGWIVWGVVALGLSAGIAVWARRHVSVALVAPAVAGGVAITIAGIGAGAVGDDWDFAWRSLLALVVAGLLALATRPAGLAPLTLAARIVTAAFFVFAYGAAVVELVDNPSLEDLAGGGHGLPLLLMGVASLVIAWLVPVVRIPAVALAVVAASALVAAPVVDSGADERAWAVVTVLAAALAAAGMVGENAWMRGVRLGALPAVAGAAIVQLLLVGDALDTVSRILADPWQVSGGARLDAASVDDRAAWVVPILLLGLVATTWATTRWPEAAGVRPHGAAVVGTVLAIGAVTSVVALRWPVWLVAASLVVLAVALAAVRVRKVAAVPTSVALALLVSASALAAASHGVSSVTWLVAGLVLLGLALVSAVGPVRQLHAVVGVAGVLAGVAATVGLLDVDDGVVPLVTVVTALSLLAVAQLWAPVRGVADAVEATAAVGLAVALLWPGTSGDFAVRWTIAGVALISLSFVVARRRWLVWPGIAALVVAYVALIVDSGFSFVEAYTLPLGAAGLAAGTWATTRRPETSTWALLGPGLAVALLPSVPQALAEPTELRALLLGVGAAVVLGVGVRLGWQAPFVAGVTILALLVLFNIGPYANAAPRVVLIAVVSAVLLAVGITWEDRVRDGRRLVTYVRSMR